MPQTQLSSRLGSDNSIFGLKEQKRSQSSKFNFSKKIFTTGDIGAIIPIDWWIHYPKDKVKLSIRYLLDTLPLEVPPMNNYFIRTHWYFIKMSALWKGWNTFITRGRSGNIDLEIPSISSSDLIAPRGTSYYSVPNSLMDYLGIKPYYYEHDSSKPKYLPYIQKDSAPSTTGYSLVEKYNALPLFAYQKICRYNYMPSNLLQDNHVWFPEDLEDHWYIDYNGSNLRGVSFVPESASLPEVADEIANFVPSADSVTGDNVVDLRQLRYGLFGRDYFTDAKPWLVRGTETTSELDSNITYQQLAQNLNVYLDKPNLNDFAGAFEARKSTYDQVSAGSSTTLSSDVVLDSVKYQNALGFTSYFSSLSPTKWDTEEDYDNYWRAFAQPIAEAIDLHLSSHISGANTRIPIRAVLTANTLRNLLALSVWQERNTLSDGSYNRFINLHWNAKPKAPEYQPLYIGGTSDLVSFGQVIQTSSSVSGSPLGSKAGTGQANGGSDVFTFENDDYGIIMGVMIISPEVVYSQGVGHEWTDLTFDEQFQPEFANLGYQPILNKEIFAQGNTDDDDLFGYQTRYAYLKQRDNTVSGLFNLKPAQDSVFGPYVQARRFNSLPELSAQFVTMSPENIDRSFLSFPYFPVFKIQFASDVSLIRQLPYQSTPETFGF